MPNETDAVALPGTTLIATAGADLTITLHNDLVAADGNVALEIPGLGGFVPDLTGAPAGGSKAYTLPTALLQPGSYVYQAGETVNGPRQQAMGLSGLLIVRPADFVAGDATTWSDFGANTGSTFSAESTVLVSELSPEFNDDPNGSNLVEYNPTIFLVNGRPFDSAAAAASMISVNPADHVLLRYADLGLREHSMGLLGLRQTEIGQDSQPVRHQTDVATVFLTPGQSTDSIALVDPAAGSGQLYPLYDAGMHLNNDADPGIGGMLAALQVSSGVAAASGPTTTAVVSAPDVNDGNSDVTLTAHVAADPGHQVTNVEWFLDTVRQSGTGFSGNAADALANSVTFSTPLPAASVDVTFTIPAASLDAYLAAQAGKNGDHILWVHGQDETSTWGAAAGDVFTLNLDGPIVSALTVDPTATNGATLSKVTVDGINAWQLNPDGSQILDVDGNPIPIYPAIQPGDLVLQGTADSSLNGWDVQSGQYCIDYTGDGTSACTSAHSLTLLAGPGSTAALAVVIPKAEVVGLTQGQHTIAVQVHEAVSGASTGGRENKWNDPGATITFNVDKTGPVVSGAVLDPNPNNGFQSNSGNLGFLDSLRVGATLDDTTTGGSTLADGEVFVGGTQQPDGSLLDPQGLAIANGTGATMVPDPGKWGVGPSELAYAYIPLAVIRAYPSGLVPFFIHGKDAAGNWGPFIRKDLTLDKTPPTISPLTVTNQGVSRRLTFTATDAAIAGGLPPSIVAAEYFFSPSCATGATDPATCVVDPGTGAGTAIPITAAASVTITNYLVSFPAPRTGRIISVRVKDAAGNWSLLSNYRYH